MRVVPGGEAAVAAALGAFGGAVVAASREHRYRSREQIVGYVPASDQIRLVMATERDGELACGGISAFYGRAMCLLWSQWRIETMKL